MSLIADLTEFDYADPIDPAEFDHTEPATPGVPDWVVAGREITVITQHRWTTVAVEQRCIVHADADKIALTGGLTVQGHASCREDQSILVKAAHEEGDEDVWMVAPDWDGTFVYRSEVDWDGLFDRRPVARDTQKAA